jgi:hypothetical protein
VGWNAAGELGYPDKSYSSISRLRRHICVYSDKTDYHVVSSTQYLTTNTNIDPLHKHDFQGFAPFHVAKLSCEVYARHTDQGHRAEM